MAATRIAAIESCVCEPGSEYTRLLVVFELVLPCLAGAGMENEFHFTVSETSGPVAGAGAENELQFNVSETAGPVTGTRVENELPDHEIGILNDFLEAVASRGQARRHAHLVGIGHAPFFQKTKEDKKFCLEIFGNDVSRKVESRGASGVTFESDVDVSGSLVLDGAFAVLVDFDVGSSGSCTAASSVGDKKKNVKRVQFFVNRGIGFTTVVRCSPDAVLSDVLHLDTDEYAVCGSRFVKVGCTLSENWIGKGSNVEVQRLLRGGAISYLDIPGQWECKVCHATRCWPARKRCYK